MATGEPPHQTPVTAVCCCPSSPDQLARKAVSFSTLPSARMSRTWAGSSEEAMVK